MCRRRLSFASRQGSHATRQDHDCRCAFYSLVASPPPLLAAAVRLTISSAPFYLLESAASSSHLTVLISEAIDVNIRRTKEPSRSKSIGSRPQKLGIPPSLARMDVGI